MDDRQANPQQPPPYGSPTTPIPPQGQYPPGAYPPPPGYGQGYPPPPGGYAPYPYPYPPVPPKKTGVPPWVWWALGGVGVLVLACVGAAVAFGMWFGNTLAGPLLATNGFYTALQEDRCADARSYLDGSGLTSIDYCARWKALTNEGNTTVGTSDSVSIVNGVATLGWRMDAGGRSHQVDVRLQERGGKWKITGAFPDLLPEPR